MAAIVRKLGSLTRYETKSYVGGAQIIDLDRSTQENLASARETDKHKQPESIDRTRTGAREPMKPEQMTETLEQAAAQLGVQVRYETMTGDAAGGGGLCKVKGHLVRDHRSQDASRRTRRDADRSAGGVRHRHGFPAAPDPRGHRRQAQRTPAPAKSSTKRPRPDALIFSPSSGSSAHRALERRPHLLADGGRRSAPICLSMMRSITRSIAALGSMCPGRELGGDVRRSMPRAAAAASTRGRRIGCPLGPSAAPSLSAKLGPPAPEEPHSSGGLLDSSHRRPAADRRDRYRDR